MAKDAKPAEETAEVPKKKNKKLLIIILAAVLLLVLAGGAAVLLLKKKADPDDEEVAEETDKPGKKKKGEHEAPPVYLALDPFTVNLIPETGGDQYLQVTVTLELEGLEAENEIKGHMAKLRNSLTLLLSSKKASELLSRDGKEQLADSLKEEINSIAAPPKKKKGKKDDDAEGPVKSVLFTSFIIQ